ncbi:Transcription initiation factor IIF subunit alpha [Taphrina deformans PYCC 5710]|uniref:Transcription initiation factor IIF subunit alpha n=1 Tax=Taphrina deformans (strain PYCC 5710 / ATCC 11124 / CBS 356.35 / IMI 108563 / JCM 9778 / NBRC 8474) TaxID=1097556 RepID=R4XJ14_TAPDE|nr:Transcription initiation factor IIF subunit alpha [Taphrina deformans PYCC 5710]|eukprot:CCG83365.1 Transcription initiation factor IIF subunit alpha [Taphrina deformans PYCC 5710]
MSSISIRAPKRKAPARPPPNKSNARPAVKKEPIEVPLDTRKWTSYTLRAGRTLSEDDGTRFNVMRFQAGKAISPASDFRRPVKLARRDLNELTADQIEEGGEEGEEASAAAAVALAATTAAVPPAAPAKPAYSVAPHGGQPLERKQFRKRTHEVYQQDEAVRQLRQEERFPWLLEDEGGKNVYQGSLEGGQGGTYVFLRLTADGFDVTPVSKFYRFGQRQKYQTMSLDEAEEKMKKHKSLPRWVMKDMEDGTRPGTPQDEPQRQYRMKTTSSNQKLNIKAEEQEEELDFNEDFADDEEQHGLVDDEEDNKELEERIKKEQLSANALGDADPEVENEADEATKLKLDKEGRRVQRFLEKLEKNNMYESDSNSNPYGSSSSDSEDEKDAKTSATTSTKGEDDEKKKSLEKSRDEKIRESVNKLQNQSRTTYNTPTGSTVISRTSSSSTLGNARAHARAKRTRPDLITLKLSPAVLAKFSDIPSSAAADKKRRAAGSDGYDSDRSQKKLRFQAAGSPSPPLSRAASPLAGSAGSRPVSPTGTPDPDKDLITAAELRALVTGAASSGGLSMKGLLRILRPKLAREPRNKTILGELMKAGGLAIVEGKLSIKD